MQWVSAISSDADCEDAVRIACAEISAQLGSSPPDLVLLFVSPTHHEVYSTIQSWVRKELNCRIIAGCTARGIIGRSLEIEVGPAISISAAIMPDVDIEAVHVDFRGMPDADAAQEAWRDWLGVQGMENCLVLADPFNPHIEDFLWGLDYAFPRAKKVGGLASAAGQAGENALFLNGRTYNHGLVLLGVSGNVIMDTIVAQGCRPAGTVATVTQSDANVIYQLNGQPAFAFLQGVRDGLGEYDRTLFKNAVFLGITTDPFVTTPEAGDFLIRNLIGIDYQTGALIVGGPVEEGALIQMHLRDRKSSRLDLENLLQSYRRDLAGTPVHGALLFSCLGRGQYLYGTTNHDSDMITESLGPVPISGFFCAGEIGPVGPDLYSWVYQFDRYFPGKG